MQFNDTTDGLYPNNLPDADKGKPLTSLSGILRAGRKASSSPRTTAPSPGNPRQQPPERNPPRNLPLPSPLLR